MAVQLRGKWAGSPPEKVTGLLAAARQSGERVCRFPMDEDYDPQLDSKVADVLQCTLEGAGDHILATRFLSRFIDDTPWVHMDLSASTCKGGLGAVMTDLPALASAGGWPGSRRWKNKAKAS